MNSLSQSIYLLPTNPISNVSIYNPTNLNKTNENSILTSQLNQTQNISNNKTASSTLNRLDTLHFEVQNAIESCKKKYSSSQNEPHKSFSQKLCEQILCLKPVAKSCANPDADKYINCFTSTRRAVCLGNEIHLPDRGFDNQNVAADSGTLARKKRLAADEEVGQSLFEKAKQFDIFLENPDLNIEYSGSTHTEKTNRNAQFDSRSTYINIEACRIASKVARYPFVVTHESEIMHKFKNYIKGIIEDKSQISENKIIKSLQRNYKKRWEKILKKAEFDLFHQKVKAAVDLINHNYQTASEKTKETIYQAVYHLLYCKLNEQFRILGLEPVSIDHPSLCLSKEACPTIKL